MSDLGTFAKAELTETNKLTNSISSVILFIFRVFSSYLKQDLCVYPWLSWNSLSLC